MALKLKAALLGGVMLMAPLTLAHAGPLADDVAALMTSHEQIKAAQADVDAAVSRKQIAEGDYFPTLSAAYSTGNERISTRGTNTQTSYHTEDADLTLSQTLWDFGATEATVDSADLAISQSKQVLSQTRQTILLQALSAQLNLISANRILKFQRQSEASIKKQAELEDERVQRGSGLTTDELQARRQLANAKAQRVTAEGALYQAINRYRAVFGKVPDDINALEIPRISLTGIPNSEEDLVAIALENNPQVKIQTILTDIADKEITRTVADKYRPALTAEANHAYKHDVSGTRGYKYETSVKVKAEFEFGFGGTASNTLAASNSGLAAAAARLKDTRDQVEEQARNAWRRLITARETAEFRQNEANIAGEFLGLAREERKLGTRSLIDVLSGETAHISALAEADRSKTQTAIAALSVMQVMGKLDVSVLQ